MCLLLQYNQYLLLHLPFPEQTSNQDDQPVPQHVGELYSIALYILYTTHCGGNSRSTVGGNNHEHYWSIRCISVYGIQS